MSRGLGDVYKRQISNDPVVCKVDGNVYKEENLYTPQINRKSSEIAQLSEIRMLVSSVLKYLFDDSNTGLVVEGRDMGSVVFKNANLKIYLDASETTRSERRIAQSGNKESVEDIRARDSRDINRKISPLIIPDDAIVINNENKSIDEVIEIIKENLKLQ